MEKPTIEQLFTDEFEQLEVLPYSEMIPFVQRQFQKPTRITRLYISLNVFMLMGMIGLAYWQISIGKVAFWQLLNAVFLGFAVSLTVLVPLHEAIHGIVYKLMGAPKVSFGGNWRKFYFYAAADRFVAGEQAFRLVALAPFVVLSVLAILGLLFTAPFVQWLLLGVLLLHTGACAGDFGMLAFYEDCPPGEIFTFDDVVAKKAYFFQRKIPAKH